MNNVNFGVLYDSIASDNGVQVRVDTPLDESSLVVDYPLISLEDVNTTLTVDSNILRSESFREKLRLKNARLSADDTSAVLSELTITIDYDDGSAPVTVNASDTLTLTNVYNASGTYNVTVTVTDGRSTIATSILVLYT